MTGAALERARAVAFEAARAAGEVLLAAFGRLSPDDVRYKGEKDLVTVVDERAQDAIVERLASEFPEHGIFAEEGTTERRDAEYRWVVDPLDGTTNFVHAYPMVSVSIALERAGAPLVGVVHAPVMGETFDAVVGGGARRNGEAIRVSRRERLIDALLGTGFACVRGGATRTNLPIVSAIAPRAQGVRRGGSAALDLAYVAMGRFDGFWELELSPWDTAAGVLLVREAGGRVTDFDDGPDFVARREIVATNGVLHPALLAAIREVPA